MKTVNTQDLTGVALDWAVAQAAGVDAAISRVYPNGSRSVVTFCSDEGEGMDGRCYCPSEHPGDGQPIIERELIGTMPVSDAWWRAGDVDGANGFGPTALIAAMRCYVAAQLGPVIEIPEELT